MNILDIVRTFPDTEKCAEYLQRLRWPEGIECPRCKAKTISTLTTQKKFECSACEYQFTVKAGTIFHDSHLPLEKWFLAVYLMTESKKGMSANQMSRVLGVSYKTAWYLCHRIRAAMKEPYCVPLTGTVEIDETYVGGKRRHVGKGYKGNKTMVLAAVQRGGEIRMRVEKRGKASKKALHKFVHQTTAADTESVYTDDCPAYTGIGDDDTTHESVNHSAEEWVRGDVHTNTVEGVFSLLKRSIIGSYHQVSAKHLDAYLDELEFRFNRRTNKQLFKDTLRQLVKSGNLTFEKLTA